MHPEHPWVPEANLDAARPLHRLHHRPVGEVDAPEGLPHQLEPRALEFLAEVEDAVAPGDEELVLEQDQLGARPFMQQAHLLDYIQYQV